MAVSLVFSIPCAIKNLLTAIALLKPKARLYSFVPISSECPSIQAYTDGLFCSHSACFLSIFLVSLERSVLSKAK